MAAAGYPGPGSSAPLRVLMPVGMLGGGFPARTIDRGVALGADTIVVDGGSTDSGPHYLGSASAKTSRAAVRRDLRILLTVARSAGIPLVVGSRPGPTRSSPADPPDTALPAAVALPRGYPARPVWHAAKTSECGGSG